MFSDELARAVANLRDTPTLGTPFRVVGETLVLRVLLPKSEQHLYYLLNRGDGVVLVLTIWGARRGSPPSF